MAQKKTVLLTGASGFIAKHITLKLLNAGYAVVGTVRALSRGDEVRTAVAPHVNGGVDLDKNLRFVALDLSRDDGWDDAMQGVDILMHTASPFPLDQPKNEDELIRPAVDGALRALRAAKAAGIHRVIMTSSSVAIMDSELAPGKDAYDEENWSELEGAHITPYGKSKTLAERAAWDFVRDEAPEIELTTINPVLVTGPPLDTNFGTSVSIIQRLLRGKDPMLPNFAMPIVDVRDIAEMHVRAISTPASVGLRFIGAESTMWFVDVAKTLKKRFPDYKIATRVAPNVLIRIMALFDKSIRQIVPLLGKKVNISSARAQDILGISFIPAASSVLETAEFLVENDQVG